MLLSLILAASLLSSVGICLGGGCFGSLAWLWVLPLSFAGCFLGLLVLALLFLVAVILPLDSKAQRTDDSRFYRTLANWYIELIVTVLPLRIEVEGLEKRPEGGRFMLVSNHLHEIDPAILMRYFPKAQLAFIAKKEVENMFLVGKLLPQLLSQFIDRENDREALKTILRCIQLLKEDKVSIGVFPEGGINTQRKLKHFRPGVFKIAQKAKVPIVVCTLRDTHKAIGTILKLKRATVTLHILDVVSTDWMEDRTTVEIADRVYETMKADLGEENLFVEENA